MIQAHYGALIQGAGETTSAAAWNALPGRLGQDWATGRFGGLTRPMRFRPRGAVRYPGDPGRLAQLGEHQLDKLGVTGSSPVPPTLYIRLRK